MLRFTVLNKVIQNVLSSSSTHAPPLHQAQLMKSAQWLWCNLTDRRMQTSLSLGFRREAE